LGIFVVANSSFSEVRRRRRPDGTCFAASGSQLPQTDLFVQRPVLCSRISLLKRRRDFSSICLSSEIARMSINHGGEPAMLGPLSDVIAG